MSNDPLYTHAHVTERWKTGGHVVIATGPGYSGMRNLTPVFEHLVAQLRDTIGLNPALAPRDEATGPDHRRQILDSTTDGWVQIDLFVCTEAMCLNTGHTPWPPEYVANREIAGGWTLNIEE